MTNKYDMMRGAMQEARATMSAADEMANTMADILAGRMRKVRPGLAAKIKKELKDFNAHTGRWKS